MKIRVIGFNKEEKAKLTNTFRDACKKGIAELIDVAQVYRLGFFDIHVSGNELVIEKEED